MAVHNIELFASTISHLLMKHATTNKSSHVGFISGRKQVQRMKKTTDAKEDQMEIHIFTSIDGFHRHGDIIPMGPLGDIDLKCIQDAIPFEKFLGWYIVRSGVAFPSVQEISFSRKLKEIQSGLENEFIFILISGTTETEGSKKQTDIGFFRLNDKEKLEPLKWKVGNINKSSKEEYSQRWFSRNSDTSMNSRVQNVACHFNFMEDPLLEVAMKCLVEMQKKIQDDMKSLEFGSKEFFP